MLNRQGRERPVLPPWLSAALRLSRRDLLSVWTDALPRMPQIDHAGQLIRWHESPELEQINCGKSLGGVGCKDGIEVIEVLAYRADSQPPHPQNPARPARGPP